MNILIDNYQIDLSSFDNVLNTITLGYEFNYAKNILSDNDFSTFLSDTLIHEFLHGLLLEQFDMTVCKLFDVVEHFISNTRIKEKVFKNIQIAKNSHYPITWHNSIIIGGFEVFLQDYHIDKNDLIQAFIITGGK